MLYFNFAYIWVLIPAMILSMYAQSKVTSTFNKYSKIANRRGFTGADAAKQILSISGINDVSVEKVRGNLTDHYDPRTKTLRLSDSVYSSQSIAAIGVAAHETGHAIQDARGYAFLRVRSALVPISSLGSNLAMPLIFLGVLFGAGNVNSGFGGSLVEIGIVFFALSVLFTIITLPVEFNASSRAIAILEDEGFLSYEEVQPAKKVLSAAALTYVAAAATAIASLLRLLLMFGGRNRD